MRINIAGTERVLRLVLGLGLVLLALLAGLSPAWSWAAAVAGLVLLATAALRFCPVWALLGIGRGPEGGGSEGEGADRRDGDRRDGDRRDGDRRDG
ncbi:YgaP-like transmembrane domain, partial [Paracoccus versutus]|uniref:YgaP-like transmembrane domain n=1 Tax=Paracoccus versutus TaxID=34007 RepID=UPI000E1B269B